MSEHITLSPDMSSSPELNHGAEIHLHAANSSLRPYGEVEALRIANEHAVLANPEIIKPTIEQGIAKASLMLDYVRQQELIPHSEQIKQMKQSDFDLAA